MRLRACVTLSATSRWVRIDGIFDNFASAETGNQAHTEYICPVRVTHVRTSLQHEDEHSENCSHVERSLGIK